MVFNQSLETQITLVEPGGDDLPIHLLYSRININGCRFTRLVVEDVNTTI